MDEDEWYRRYGLQPTGEDLDRVRDMLRAQATLRSANDSALIRLGCVQLFLNGDLADVLLIWRARQSSFDAACSVEWQLLCGAGLERTREHLRELGTAEAGAALAYLEAADGTEDAAAFTVEDQSHWYAEYYGP